MSVWYLGQFILIQWSWDIALLLLARRQKDVRLPPLSTPLEWCSWHSGSLSFRCWCLCISWLYILYHNLNHNHNRKKPDRIRLATLNCRTLLADEFLDDLDDSLIISICALQEVCRYGLLSTYTKNYKVYWFGECKGHLGVGLAIHKKYDHLVSAVRGLSDSDGRIMTMDILIYDEKKLTTLVCADSTPNTRKHEQSRREFYLQVCNNQ